MAQDDIEIWKPIEGFDGYEVSSLGRLRSYRVGGHLGQRRAVPRILRRKVNKSGYCYAPLVAPDGKTKKYLLLHRVVCRAFHGEPPDPSWHADHFPDRTTTNNRENNVRWLLPEKNLAARQFASGERNGCAKITDQQRDYIRASRRPSLDLAEEFGLHRVTINAIKRSA